MNSDDPLPVQCTSLVSPTISEAPMFGTYFPISVVILTFNSAASIERTLATLVPLFDDIHVVDSFSSDNTVALCQRMGAQVVQHAFAGYSVQRNWAIDTLPLRYGWQFHIDADEELESDLQIAISQLNLTADAPIDGFIIGRKIVFMGRVLRYGAIAKTWHYRLFKTGHGRCEKRLYDQHFVSVGRVGQIRAYMLDHQEMSLSEWTTRHNRWSDLEAHEASMYSERSEVMNKGQVVGDPYGNVIARKRHAKGQYYHLPLFWRAILYAFYRYILRLGFLDGTRGFIFHILQGFWFRVLVDAKIFERSLDTREHGPHV